MHLLRRRWRTGSAGQCRGVRKVWFEPVWRGQAADVRRDVFDQVVAGRRRRNHCPDLQGTSVEARLRLRLLGLDDRLWRGNPGLTAAWADTGKSRGNAERLIVMTFLLRIRLLVVAVTLLSIAAAVPTQAQKLSPDGAPNPTASVVDEQTLLKQAPPRRRTHRHSRRQSERVDRAGG